MNNRKILLLSIFLSLIICSCSDSKKVKLDSFSDFQDTPICKINASFPFGCEFLVSHKFPKNWEAKSYDSTNSKAKYKPHVKEIYKTWFCFDSINLQRTISLPIINKVEFLKIDSAESKDFNDLLLHSIDSCKYRLPDIGIYECYYVYAQPSYSSSSDSTNKFYEYFNYKKFGYDGYCIGAGNLILYHRASKSAKLLNLYHTIVEEITSSYRLFYIDKAKTIQIFSSYGRDTEMYIIKKFSISILDNGEIKIKSELY